jgi:hypothetical protein
MPLSWSSLPRLVFGVVFSMCSRRLSIFGLSDMSAYDLKQTSH